MLLPLLMLGLLLLLGPMLLHQLRLEHLLRPAHLSLLKHHPQEEPLPQLAVVEGLFSLFLLLFLVPPFSLVGPS